VQLDGLCVAVDQFACGNLDITDDGAHHNQDDLADCND
jgi:hypothetical protein